MATSKIRNTSVALKTYTYNYSISANSYISVTGSDLGLSVPTGMKVIGIRNFATGNSNVYASRIVHSIDGTCAILRSNNDQAATGTFSVGFIYVNSEMVNEIS